MDSEMATAAPGPDPPLGITQLEPLEHLLVRQKAYAGNKYEILDTEGRVILLARDETNALGQLLSGTNRALNIDVFDTQDRLVLKLRRPYTFGQDKMEVYIGGRLRGVVRQEVTLLKPVLSVSGPGGERLLRVKGPASTAGECDFDVFNTEKKKVGIIRKTWGGGGGGGKPGKRDPSAEGESFQVLFPAHLDVTHKAAILATCLLIDFLFYES